MSHNQHPQQAEQGPELPPAMFDFENMPVDFIRKVNRLLYAVNEEVAWGLEDDSAQEQRKYDLERKLEPVAEAVDRDLTNLPYRNIDRGRELIIMFAHSDQVEDRYAVAFGAMASLIRRECELGTEDLTEQADLMLTLANDRDSDLVGEAAYLSAAKAVKQGWWREDVAARVLPSLL